MHNRLVHTWPVGWVSGAVLVSLVGVKPECVLWTAIGRPNAPIVCCGISGAVSVSYSSQVLSWNVILGGLDPSQTHLLRWYTLGAGITCCLHVRYIAIFSPQWDL